MTKPFVEKRNVSWEDTALRVGQKLLLRLHTAYSNECFKGLSEQDIISIVGDLFDASGYDTYYEDHYKDHFEETETKDIKDKCDVVGYNWKDDKVFCEVKVLYGDFSNHLYKKEFYEGRRVIFHDIEKLLSLPYDADKLFILVVFSELPRSFNNHNNNSSRVGFKELLQSVTEKIDEKNKPKPVGFHYHLKETDCPIVHEAKEGMKHVNVFSWWF